ncbi:MAG: ATP-binding protein [Eubacteriales bacterium]|nr:ATP-binding protein [Eubacteriales bacterium]
MFIYAVAVKARLDEKEHRLKAKETFFDAVTRDGTEAYALIRISDGKPEYVSESLKRMLGDTEGFVSYDMRSLLQFVPNHDRREFEQSFAKWDETREGELVHEFPYRGAAERYAELRIFADHTDRYYIVIFRDITSLHSEMAGLRAELDKAEQESASKSRFLSNMSHEIRTPMNGINGMMSLARINIDKGEDVKLYLEKAEELSKHLLSLINDILDMSRMESGKMELEKASFSLTAMAEKLRTMFQRTIEEKGIEFVLEMKDFTEDYVVGDELRLSQVVINFISNSVKFTEKGGIIAITYRQMGIIDDKMHLMIRVRDTGKGIEPEFLSRIFRPFEQESTRVTKKYGGSGLGMAISDNIIRLMGGQIVVDSVVGKGSDFTVYVTLPIGTAPAAEETAAAADIPGTRVTLDGLHALMAEDNDINAEIAIAMLELKGMTVDRAVDGIKVVEQFAASKAGEYDLIFMDIHMPEQDGYDATKQIRALSRNDASTIPIFALSADAFVEDKRHAIEVGMNGHISKPIDFDELEKTVTEYLTAVRG